MHRKFIAAVSAAAIALTALGAAPAAAGEKETVRALAAILGIAVVGKIIHDNVKDRDQVTRHAPAPVYQPHKPHKPQYHQPQPKPMPSRVSRKLLPQQCFRSFETYQGNVRMFGKRCLENNYRFTSHLPQHCMSVVRTYNGKRRGFEARCLRDAGYRMARR